MTIGSTWSVDTDDDDALRCFELDPGVTEDTWYSGFEIVPGNPKVNHHAIVFVVADGASGTDLLDAYADSYGAGESWECFGTATCGPDDPLCPGRVTSKVVGAWTPNAGAVELPPSSAIKVSAGERFVVQIHYHPQTDTQTETDADTQLDLQLYDGDAAYQATMNVVGLFEPHHTFDDNTNTIPADDPSYSNSASKVLPASGIWGVLPHMHVVGTALRVDIDRANGDDECLVDVPEWDYQWQRIYRIASLYDDDTISADEGPILSGNDTAVVTCTYDNTADNLQLVEAYDNEGLVDGNGDVLITEVPIGDSTNEEMCVAVIGLLTPL